MFFKSALHRRGDFLICQFSLLSWHISRPAIGGPITRLEISAQAGVVEQRQPKRQPAPSNIKPCYYKHKTFKSTKCTEAGINSHITVPSKVHASQDPKK